MGKKNIKIENLINSFVTLNLRDFSNRVVRISPKGFGRIDEDELTFLMNNSTVFKKGTVKVANNDVLSEDIPKEELESPNIIDDKEITNLLKKSQKKLAEALSEIDSPHTIKRILECAKEQDKSLKVVEIIENRLEELMS